MLVVLKKQLCQEFHIKQPGFYYLEAELQQKD